MTPFDVVTRVREEWQVTPTKRERMVLALETFALVVLLLSVAVTMKVLGDMIRDYIIERYVTETVIDDERRNKYRREVQSVTDDNTIQ